MNSLLESIFNTGKFVNKKNEPVEVNSQTSKEQCRFLQEIIDANKFRNSIEIGFAFGISTLAIIESVAKNNGTHTAIDKFEHTSWMGNGIDLVAQAGYSNRLEFIEEYCYESLPSLLKAKKKFDFAYIDSTKQFDWLLVDFFYIDKMLQVNGIIVFDDVNFPGIRKLLRYLCQFPDYKVYRQFPSNKPLSFSRKLSSVLKFLPKSKKILRSDLLKTDYDLGINCSCVALIKTGEDQRNWDWHKDF